MFTYTFQLAETLLRIVLTPFLGDTLASHLHSLNLPLATIKKERRRFSLAMFHFRLKSDKKPNGTSISAVQHVDYIQRQGRFKNVDQQNTNNQFVGDSITSAETKDAFGGRSALLYKTDDFGSIANSQNGIEVTENASPTTISIALMIADETMNHQPLILNGSKKFKKSVLEAAVQADLHITFADKRLNDEFNRRKESVENERKSFINNGGTFIKKRSCPKPYPQFSNEETIASLTKRGLHLPTLSQLPLVHSESEDTDLLLPSDEIDELVEQSKKLYSNVRWDVHSERRQLAQHTAKEILNRIEDNMDQVFASSHVEYINRERAFAKRGGCIFHAHYLPKWAKDDPKKFFRAADKYEGKDNRRYREIEFALPNELKTVEQYRQIIDAFIDKHLKDHYYAYAIHDKIGVMSNGQHHPHVHIMFSERMIDDVEKTHERTPQNFFKYPARKSMNASFEERRKHGAPKNRHWTEKSFLAILRADFAQIQNEVLKKNGFSIRVDHRSLKAQKEEAERNGDRFLMQLFDRIPEQYIGVISTQEDDNPKIQRLKHFRELRDEHKNLLFDADFLDKEIEELEAKDQALNSSTNAKKFMDSDEYKNNSFDSTLLKFLRQDLLNAIDEVNKWKRILISRRDAEEQAKLEYMSKEEREIWHQFHDAQRQIANLESFKQTLHEPQDKNALDSFNDIVDGIDKKITALKVSSIMMKPSIKKIEDKLETPDCKKNIQIVTHNILQNNFDARRRLKVASQHLDDVVLRLRQEIIFNVVAEEPKDIFKTKEIYNIVRRQFFGLKKEYEKSLALKNKLKKRVISLDRAIAIAQNIFTNGDLKKLRERIRLYKKEEQFLTNDFALLSQRDNLFKSKDWSADERPAFLQEQYEINKQKTLLNIRLQKLHASKNFIAAEQLRLNSLLQKSDSQEKINEIAAGILRKNAKFVNQYEQAVIRSKELAQNLKHANEQMKILKIHVNIDKPRTCYRLNKSSTDKSKQSNNAIASIIADALLREDYAVQLVARSNGNNLELEKNWDLISDLEKDELETKELLRDI